MMCSTGMEMGAMACASKIPMLLLALAAGYLVLVKSQGQNRPLDVLGRIVGGIILISATVSLLCAAWCGFGRCHKGGMDRRCGIVDKDCSMQSQSPNAGQPIPNAK